MDMHLSKSCSSGLSPVEHINGYFSLYIRLEPTERSDIYRCTFSPHRMKRKILSVVVSIGKGAVNTALPSVVRFAGRIAATPSASRGDSRLGTSPPTPSVRKALARITVAETRVAGWKTPTHPTTA